MTRVDMLAVFGAYRDDPTLVFKRTDAVKPREGETMRTTLTATATLPS